MKIITDPDEVRKTYHWLKKASKQAKKSDCKKSKRGAVLIKDDKIIGTGHNKITIDKLCNPCMRESIKDNSRVELCSAIHAEQMALIDASKKRNSIENSVMYHIKVKDEQMTISGNLSCTVCSRIILEANIQTVFWQKQGYILYSPEEFNQLSFDYFVK